jgi:Ig-like domain CHU_C associated
MKNNNKINQIRKSLNRLLFKTALCLLLCSITGMVYAQPNYFGGQGFNNSYVPSGTCTISPSSTVLCLGTSVTLTASGSGPYVWSNGATTQSITVSPTDTTVYTVIVGYGCTRCKVSSTVFTVPNTIMLSISTTNVTSIGNNNGAATANASGGVSPFTYSWSNGATTSGITGLSAGSYTVTVTDANGCTASSICTILNQSGLPSYLNTNATVSANAIPYNLATSNRVQYIYAPNTFSTLGSGGGVLAPSAHNITKIYIKFSGTVNPASLYSNFTISLGQSLGAINNFPQAPASTNVPFYGALTQCFYQSSGFQFTGITANGWYGIQLQTPFNYNPSQALIVELKVSAGTGNSVGTISTAGISQRIYGGYSSSTGTANTLLTPLGFDVIPAAACVTPPTAGTSTTSVSTVCTGSNFTLDIVGNSVGSGQTYQWQSGSSVSGPWTNIGSSQSFSNLMLTASATQYYKCVVTCSGQSSSSTPVLVSVPPLFSSGTYTIDQTQVTSASNFTSFASAMSAIGCGIAGPIVFNVVPGTGPYNEQVTVGQVPNTSSINTVTINGNGNTLAFAGNASNLHTLGMNGTDYFIINNLTISGTDATYGLTCHLWNNADYNTFNNCTFMASITGVSSTTSPFSVSGSATSPSTSGSSGNNNVLTNCTAIGGYYSIIFYGNSTTPNTGNKVISCISQDMYLYGIYSLYNAGWEVSGCTVERVNRNTVSATYGIYASTGAASALIRNNKIRNLFPLSTTTTSQAYGVYIGADGVLGNETQVYNNMIYGIQSNGPVLGLYLPGVDYIKAYHNTISMDDAGSTSTNTSYGIYNSGTVGGIDIKNNIVSITRGGTGTKYGLYYTSNFPSSNNNDVYMNASGGAANYWGFYNGTNYLTMATFQTASSKDLQSVNDNPLFTNMSLSNFTPTNASVNNIGTPVGITTDHFGNARSLTTPDVGGIEFNVANIDMSLQNVLSPNLLGCYTSSEQVVVSIKNFGNNPIDFSLNPANITVSINGPVNYTVTASVNVGTLAAGASQSVNLSPQVNLTTNGIYNVTGNIAVAGDANATNNTITPFTINIGVIAGTISSNIPSPICSSNPPTFSLAGQYGGSIQWQTSTVSASGPWTNVGTGTTTYAAGVQTQNYWVRVASTCNTNIGYSNVIAITVNNPSITSTTPATRCGTGTVNLTATPNAGTINWYANASGGAPLFAGSTFTTPTIVSTTTYYAAATVGGSSGNVGLANRVGTTTNSGYADVGLMFDATLPFTLNSVAVYPVAITPSGNVTATIALKNSAGTILASTTVSVPTSVSPGVKTVVPLNFSVPAGTGHRLVFTAATGGGITGFIREATTGFVYPYTYASVASITSAYTGGVSSTFYYYFYDWSISNGCEGVRVPVVATVNSAPTITTNNTSICAGSSTLLNVTSSNPNYTYTWTPGNLLGATQSITPAATTTFTVNALDNTAGVYAGCALVATQVVTINPLPTISGTSATPAAINPSCNTPVVLSATTSAPFTGTIGTASSALVTSVTGVTPYSSFYEAAREQYIVRASELSALGFTAGNLTSIAFDVTTVAAPTTVYPQLGFSIKIANTNDAAFAGAYATPSSSFQTVYGPVSQGLPTLGINTYNFSSPYYWDGVSNIVVDVVMKMIIQILALVVSLHRLLFVIQLPHGFRYTASLMIMQRLAELMRPPQLPLLQLVRI